MNGHRKKYPIELAHVTQTRFLLILHITLSSLFKRKRKEYANKSIRLTAFDISSA